MRGLGIHRLERVSAASLAAMSRDALDRPLEHDAMLTIAEPFDAAIVLGAFQRASEIASLAASEPRLVRGSGGAEVLVGPGVLWLQLALARPGALVPCEPDRLLNRYVRPLLRAITKAGVTAHYFERDWVSGAKRPVAAIAFAHDARSGRALVEAFVAVSSPFAGRARPSTMGKAPATLAELGARVDATELLGMIAAAYETAYARSAASPPQRARASESPALAGCAEPSAPAEPPWAATRDEAIGLIGAGRDRAGRLRVGGELMASRDAVEALERGLATLAPGAGPDAVGALVDATLGAPGVALFGVRSLRSIRDAVVDALAI